MSRKPQNTVPVPKHVILPGGCLKESDYIVRRMTAKVPVTHTLKDIEAPNYFQFYADVLAKARGFGPVKLEVIADDCSLHADYLVLNASAAGVTLRRLNVYYDASTMIDTPDPEEGKQEYIKHWANIGKWRIVHHGKIILSNIQDREKADEIAARLNAGTLDLDDAPKEYGAVIK